MRELILLYSASFWNLLVISICLSEKKTVFDRLVVVRRYLSVISFFLVRQELNINIVSHPKGAYYVGKLNPSKIRATVQQ